jgi:hypothetical protein
LDAIPNADGDGDADVEIGVPGIPIDTLVRYRIAFCRKSGNLKGCHCWSQPAYFDPDQDGTPNVSPSTFSGADPSAPTGFVISGEDLFRRPPTNARSTPGDGLGASAWIDNLGPASQQPKIATTSDCPSGQNGISDCADAPAGLFAYGAEMPSANTYGEAFLRPKTTFAPGAYQMYNFALNGRYSTGYAATPVFAQAKFFRGFLQACKATLVVMSHSEVAKFTPDTTEACNTCANYWAVVRPTPAAPMPDGFCWQGSTTPPLNEYFWVRSTIVDNAENSPVVSASIAWGCADGASMSTCTQISLTRTFPLDVGFGGVLGRWFLEPHDAGDLISIARFGVTPTP